MKTIRFNIFNQVHKGLRAMLFDTTIQLQHTDFRDAEAAAPALQQLSLVLHTFDDHAYHEDHEIFPAIENTAPQIARELEAEHVTDHQLCESLFELLENYRRAASADERELAGRKIQLAFHDFTAFNLSHMNKEERVINQYLWESHTDEELMGISKAIVQKISPEKMAVYAGWMMKGLGNHEIIGWLEQVKKEAPGFVFQNLLSVARKELPASRLKIIEEKLTAEEAVLQ